MNKPFPRADKRFFLFLMAVHAVFFTLALVYKRIYMGDSFEYVYMALNIKEKFWFYCGNPALPVVPEYLTLRPPLYPLFLAFVYLFIVNNWVVIVLQNLISIFNIYYLRDTIKKVGYSTSYDYLLMMFVLLYPAQFVHTNTIAPDLLLQSCVLVYFRQFILLIQKKALSHGFWMSIALIAGLFVKPVLYPFVPIHFIILLIVAVYQKTGLIRSLATGLLPILAIVLYMGWNYQRTGKMHFSSNQSFNAIYYYYFYFADKDGIKPAQAFLQAERSKMEAMPEFADRYTYGNKRGMQLLRENFGSYMPYHIKHSVRLLIDPGKGEWDMFTGKLTLGGLYQKESGGFYASIKEGGWKGLQAYIERNPSFAFAMVVFVFNILRLIGLIIFVFGRRVDLPVRLFVVCLIGYFAITTGPIANTRYFIPVSLIAIGCAVIGYQQLLQRRKNKTIIAA